ncbi:hypothetical protein ACHAWC_006865 [Mediolabrus comicus]
MKQNIVPLLALFVLCGVLKVTAAFGVHQPIRLSKSNRGSKSSSSSSIRMYIDAPDIDIPLFQPLSTAPPSSSPTLASNVFNTQMFASDLPHMEAEILSDASHVALDFSTLLSPNTAVIRLVTLVGRVLLLSSDYIQDQYISPDEWIFQLCMLAISTRSFIRSVRPIVSASISNSTLTVRDRKAYSLLFDIVGLSMLQFKTLLSSKTAEWVQLDSNEEIVMNGEYIYWLYSGETSSSIPTEDCRECTSSKSSSLSSRIFGEVQFAIKLQESLSKKNKEKSRVESTKMVPEGSTSSLTAGDGGAVLLRISTSKLLELMSDDNELSLSVQRLVLLCMQEKLSRTFCGEEAMTKKNSSMPVVTNCQFP